MPGAGSVSVALAVAASLIVPPLSDSAVVLATSIHDAASSSRITYEKISAVVPVPLP